MTNTDDDERAAREWVELAILRSPAEDLKHRATILRLLDRPTCPRGADVPDDVIFAMHKAYDNVTLDLRSSWRAAIDVLHAWRTAPPPVKKVEAWAVINGTDHVLYSTRHGAETYQQRFGGRLTRMIEAADADK